VIRALLLWIVSAGNLVLSIERFQHRQRLKCKPPQGDRIKTPSAPVGIAGDYDFQMVLVSHDSIPESHVSGTLRLTATSRNHRSSGDRHITFPFYGSSSIELGKLGEVTVAHPVSSTDPDRPGVQVSYDSRDSTLSMMLGNSYGSRGMATDAGVVLDVRTLTDSEIGGRWDNGARTTAPLFGYYCLSRRTRRAKP